MSKIKALLLQCSFIIFSSASAFPAVKSAAFCQKCQIKTLFHDTNYDFETNSAMFLLNFIQKPRDYHNVFKNKVVIGLGKH